MVTVQVIEQLNLQLVNFITLYASIEVEIINDLEKYGLLNKKKINRDIKKIFYHHFFYIISETLLKLKGSGRIIFLCQIDKLIEQDILLTKYFAKEDIKKYIEEIICRLLRLLPVSMYSCDSNVDIDKIKLLYNTNNGNIVELVMNIQNYAWNREFIKTYYTFAKIKGFAKRNGLVFLDERYFNQLKTKQLLFA